MGRSMATMMFANWETQDEEKRWGYRLAPYQIAKEKVFGVSDFLSYRLRFIGLSMRPWGRKKWSQFRERSLLIT